MTEVTAPRTFLRVTIVGPFLLVALIWGSTWYVITGQIAQAPPAWTICWRFMLATPAMFAVAALLRNSLAIGRSGHGLALLLGLIQFCANLNFVYNAELHLTSGIVAVMFALMIVTNAALAWVILGERVTKRFWLSGVVAFSGMVLLLIHEAHFGLPRGDVMTGALLTLAGIGAASIANVLQAAKVGRALPMASLLAWAMLYGTGFNALLALATEGLPVLPSSGEFWAGLAWLAIGGSVVTFYFYYGLIRKIGAGRAAYQNILVIIVAMLISTGLEGYRWSLLSVLGALLALAGTVMALRERS